MTVNGMAKDEAKDLAMHFLTKVRIPEQAESFRGSCRADSSSASLSRVRSACSQKSCCSTSRRRRSIQMVKEVLETMKKLAEEGMTMLCVTHEMGFAREVADRIVFMNEGKIVEQAAPEDFFNHPASERARVFPRPDHSLDHGSRPHAGRLPSP